MTKIKRFIAFLLVVLMIPLFSIGGQAEAHNPQYAFQTVDMLISASGMSKQDWAAEAQKQRLAGLNDPVTEEEVKEKAPNAQIFRNEDTIYMIQNLEGLACVHDTLEAYHFMYRMAGLLHAADGAALHLWSVLSMGTQQIYTFQQIYEGCTVPASTAKIVTDADGRVTAVFSSLSPVLPESTGTELISANEAEKIARQYLIERHAEDSVLPDHTTLTVIAQDESEASDILPDILSWVVYSRNPRFSDSTTVDLPYLAHFIGVDGTYLHNCAVAIPEDPAIDAGYSSAYAFEFMEPSEWTGDVLDLNGNRVTMTVPVMRDTRTGVWYLADPSRKIAVGDFSALVYGDGAIHLVAQTDNLAWNDEDLITYANMIQVWDFFASSGWIGSDGVSTPILLLRNLCTEDGESIYNAAYIGKCRGWQCFAYGGNSYIGQSMDVIAHEFTHCMTDSIMNTNLYHNDMGAINEALSDILGNLCEMICLDTKDTGWQIGEANGTAFRSMLDPHQFEQPEYVWDIFYVPNASIPNDMNDRGGVHYNSSLLNYVAAHLCEDYGMSLADAKNFWLHAAFVLTPTTTYAQISNVLPWALQVSGNNDYLPALDALIQHTRLAETQVPSDLPANQRMVSLQLPDTPAFRNGQWVLYAIQLDTHCISERLAAIRNLAGQIIRPGPDGADYRKELYNVLDMLHLDPGSLLNYTNSETGIQDWLRALASDILSYHVSWESDEKSGITIVLKNVPTLYMLIGTSDENENAGSMAFLIDDEWFDLSLLLPDFTKEDPPIISDDLARFFTKFLEQIAKMVKPETQESQTVVLSSNGLETITLPEPEEMEYLPEDPLNSVGCRSQSPLGNK